MTTFWLQIEKKLNPLIFVTLIAVSVASVLTMISQAVWLFNFFFN